MSVRSTAEEVAQALCIGIRRVALVTPTTAGICTHAMP